MSYVYSNRRKARGLAAAGVGLGWVAAVFSALVPVWWPITLFSVTVFGATAAIAGVTWWGTRSDGEPL